MASAKGITCLLFEVEEMDRRIVHGRKKMLKKACCINEITSTALLGLNAANEEFASDWLGDHCWKTSRAAAAPYKAHIDDCVGRSGHIS